MSDFERVVAAMSEPSFYSPPAPHVDVRETHVSVVFLAGERAYKLKKPVRTTFLDYSTRAARQRFCAEEVRLNRRFAPDIYAGVASIVERDRRLMLLDTDDPRALEHVVVMRRFAEEATLAHLVASRAADDSLAARVGGRVAELHGAAARGPSGSWSPAYVHTRLDDNFEAVEAEVGSLIDQHAFEAVQRFSHAFLDGHAPLVERREAGGMVRDVHGDLRAEHVLIEPGGISIVDCIEFDPRLRRIDVAADLAFLTMDLEHLGAPALAHAVADAYVQRTGDAELYELLPFYACYRAWVRVKVTVLRLRQLAHDDDRRGALEAEARALTALSGRLAWRARLPLVIVVCGVAGSGKSTLAAALAQRSGLPHLNSDMVRKELAGMPTDAAGSPALYTPESIARTYGELAARTAQAVESQGGAIVDATFHRREQRVLLHRLAVPVLWIECTAPASLLRRRTAARSAEPQHASDATWDVSEAQLSAREPLAEVAVARRRTIRTNRPITECLAELESFVSDAVDDD